MPTTTLCRVVYVKKLVCCAYVRLFNRIRLDVQPELPPIFSQRSAVFRMDHTVQEMTGSQ